MQIVMTIEECELYQKNDNNQDTSNFLSPEKIDLGDTLLEEG